MTCSVFIRKASLVDESQYRNPKWDNSQKFKKKWDHSVLNDLYSLNSSLERLRNLFRRVNIVKDSDDR